MDAHGLHEVLDRYASVAAWETVFAEMVVFGAFDGGRLVGVAAVRESAAGAGYLCMCNVAERRRGHGSKLIAARLDHARDRGWLRVTAHVDAQNVASMANLAGHGFEVVERDGDLLTAARQV